MGFFDKFKRDKVLKPEERREKSNAKIKTMGIACNENLPMIESSNDIKLKNLDEICKRAIACLISTQLACSIAQEEDYANARTVMLNLLKQYDAENDLLQKEKVLFDGNFTKQNVIDVVWTYETYWAIIWALDLITDKEMANATETCNTERAIAVLLETSKDYEFFKSMCKLRNVEKILDMLDLFYRYHWACVEKSIRPETSIGELNPEVVMERRRGLEWLISDKKDWNEISLDT